MRAINLTPGLYWMAGRRQSRILDRGPKHQKRTRASAGSEGISLKALRRTMKVPGGLRCFLRLSFVTSPLGGVDD